MFLQIINSEEGLDLRQSLVEFSEDLDECIVHFLKTWLKGGVAFTVFVVSENVQERSDEGLCDNFFVCFSEFARIFKSRFGTTLDLFAFFDEFLKIIRFIN